ncbi:conserved hypothetical protein [Nitrobacter winogradskyi Nb-255]|uniref:Phosphate starvation-inducible protein PsiF n=1 Tax=Nitrobacter winogradskyi (strain ATCC 25391 / DSM 10237 / CIP 104748 / NCIMB 11846 / Nb-255) TaxID=323098 RepID=Q3SUN6_NITWN|nr:PsiF family protein [Nitrobacter winogradskyi]ABA04005.1 conserved hypothetical protein [Nitrobacter winogradskyi Nb-255]
MTMFPRVIAVVAASLLLGATAFAQAPATEAPAAASKAASTAKKAHKTQKAQKANSTASLECTKEADAKGLRGKERKKFRAECKAKAAQPN